MDFQGVCQIFIGADLPYNGVRDPQYVFVAGFRSLARM